jgi:hypothetical protein
MSLFSLTGRNGEMFPKKYSALRFSSFSSGLQPVNQNSLHGLLSPCPLSLIFYTESPVRESGI